MQTFNDEKKKKLKNTEQRATSTAGTVARNLAQKANPTLMGSDINGGAPAVGASVAPKTTGASGARVQNNAPAMIGNYAFDTDFQAMVNDAVARGDYGSAAEYERLRNQKLGYMDSPYSATYKFNYADPYRGQLERMQEDIINREPFSYDYRDDDQYKAMLNLKKKEAQKAYDDGYAAMSGQFEGGVPVAMINKLLDTKADIVDQADSYIPQLRQLAYQMYMNEGDQMMRNYSMMQDAANQDYNRWATERDMAISGAENAYNRAWNEKTYADDVAYRDKVFDQTERWNQANWDMDDRAFYEERSRYNDEKAYRDKVFDYGVKRDGVLDDQWLKGYELENKYYDLDHYRAHMLGK